MIPERGPDTSIGNPEEQAFRASYRHGRILVFTLVAVTAGLLLQSAVGDLWSNGIHGFKNDQYISWTIQGLVCWYALRGGQFASGCLAVIYGFFFVLCLLIMGYLAANGFHPWRSSSDRDPDMGDIVLLTATCTWSAFALWVLLISKDVRLYKDVRRRAANVPDVDPFEWPPPRRRQGRPS